MKVSRSRLNTGRFHSDVELSLLNSYSSNFPDTLVQGLVDAYPGAVCLLQNALGVCAMNGKALVLLGFLPDEFSHSDIPSDFFETFFKQSRPLLASGKTGTALFSGNNGKAFSLQYHVTRMAGAEPPFWLMKLDEVLPEKPPVYAVQACMESTFQELIDTFDEAVVVVDENGIVCHLNTVAENLFGYARNESVQLEIKQLISIREDEIFSGKPNTMDGLNHVLSGGREVVCRHRDGHLFSLCFSVGDLHQGGRHWLLGVARDVNANAWQSPENTLLVLSSAVEQSPSAIMLTDPVGNVTYVNQAYTQLTGYRPQDLIGKPPGSMPPGGDGSGQCHRLWRTMQLGGVWVGDIEEVKKDGEKYWASEMISPIADTNGSVTHYVIVQRDVTESVKDRQALRESEERFRSVADRVGEWLWEQDEHGCYSYSSTAVSKILGYEPEEIMGRSYLTLLTPEDSAYWQFAQPVNGCSQPFEKQVNRYRHRDGHEVYTQSSGEPLFDDSGRLLKWRGMDLDITASRQFENILRTQERAMESASVGISICDARQSGFPVVYVNPALCRITGYSPDEIVGESLRMLQGLHTDPASTQVIRTALSQGDGCKLILRNYRKDGSPFWNELLISPVRDEKGMVTHFVGIQNDITERLRLEEEQRQLAIARQIQLSLLPKKPLILPGIEVAGVCIPAAHVGGDYFDYFHKGDWLDIVIADVSGHDVGAALIMTEMRSTFKAGLCMTDFMRIPHSPGNLLEVLNEQIYEDLSNAELFITMFYLRIDLKTLDVTYANAGHNKPLLLKQASGACLELDADGLVLGVSRQVVFEEKSLRLEAGDRLLLYTDGTVDAMNDKAEFFGEERLCSVFAEHRHLSSEAILDNLRQAVQGFSASPDFADDISMVTVSVTGNP